MNPRTIKFERVEGRKPFLELDDRESFINEGRLIREADERDETNAFLEAWFLKSLDGSDE